VKGEVLRSSGNYALCRCGKSKNKPFCDDAHEDVGFDGAETGESGLMVERQKSYQGTSLTINDDRSLCMRAGFCGTRITNVWKMIEQIDDTQVRAQIMAMVERCPSGALTYSLEPEGTLVEPHLPDAVAVIPDGPLWISGGIPVEMSNGQVLEARNRVTLCRCGASSTKPLCDGKHKEIGFSAP
jgi:CDGSH-type Zn-finger protein